MFDSQSTAFADDILKPETREELQNRLGNRAVSNRRYHSDGVDAGTYSSGTHAAGRTGRSTGSFIGPMTRGQTGTPSFSIPARSQTVPHPRDASRNDQAAGGLWQDPNARRGFVAGLVLGTFVLVCWLFWPVAAKETPQPLEETQATVTDVGVDVETPATEQPVSSETPVPSIAVPPKAVEVTIDSLPTDAFVILDGEVQPKKTPIQLPLKPGEYAVQLSREGYEPLTRTLQVPKQTAGPFFAHYKLERPMDELPLETEAPEPLPVFVISDPPGARIFVEGQPTDYVTPKELPDYFSKDVITVQLAGYHLRDRISTQGKGIDIVNFSLERDVPRVTTMRDYGFHLTPEQNKTIAQALRELLEKDWNADPEAAVRDAKHQVAAREKFANYDPRLSHAHGLLLWHHGKVEEAKKLMAEAVKDERQRGGRKVPYFPLMRDKIRLESITQNEEIAALDLVDLMKDTARTLETYPQEGSHQARKNAEFAGQLLGFLEGPVKERLTGKVNPRQLGSQIAASLPTEELKRVFDSARQEVGTLYEAELDKAAAQLEARLEKEKALQKSGELGQRSIRGKDNRLNGRHDRSDYNAQTVTPFRIPTGPSFFGNALGLVGGAVGPVGNYNFPNLIFTSGPAISKTIFNKRTNDLTRFLRKEVKEQLPSIQRRRPQALTTYMPQELERKRRELLRSVPEPSDN